MRYTLRDLDMLKRIMKHPGRGQSYVIESLAEATGISRSQVGRLHAGTQQDLDVYDAHKIAEALGVAVLVLFMPPASPK